MLVLGLGRVSRDPLSGRKRTQEGLSMDSHVVTVPDGISQNGSSFDCMPHRSSLSTGKVSILEGRCLAPPVCAVCVFLVGPAFARGSDFIAMIDTSGLTPGIFYKLCVDHDGGGNWQGAQHGGEKCGTAPLLRSWFEGRPNRKPSISGQGCDNFIGLLGPVPPLHQFWYHGKVLRGGRTTQASPSPPAFG